MKTIRAILIRFAGLFRRKQLEAEISEELCVHLDALTERNLAAGMSPDEARYAALRTFGGMAQIQERARDERRSLWGEQLLQDVRYAIRALRKSPSFTVTAVLTLAFGIGVNAALFTVFNAVALRPLPVKDPDALIKIAGTHRNLGHLPNYSYAEYVAYRDASRRLSGIAAVHETTLRLDAKTGVPDPMFAVRGPDAVPVQFVSDNYFELLSGQITLGRGFHPDENRVPGAAPVVVLSHLFWERRFNRDPAVLGQTITLGGKVYNIIGVSAPEFVGQHPAPPAGWIPLMMRAGPETYGPRGSAAYRLIGRLQPGVTEEEAKAELDVIAARVAAENPGERKDGVRLERGMRFIKIPVHGKMLAAVTPVLLGFGMVLVIACTNVANLLLARGVTRQSEIGMRLTLGASRGRIIRQLFTENLLLCTIGAAVGLALALATLRIIQPIIFAHFPAEWAMQTRGWQFLELVPDLRVAGFTLILTLMAALAAGLLPALQAARGDLNPALKNEGSAFGRALGQSRLRSVLVISQVAVCLMLLSCAGLLARNLFTLRNSDLGFDPHAIFQVYVSPKIAGQDRRQAFDHMLTTLQATRELASASGAYRAPLLGAGGTSTSVTTTASAAAAEMAHALPYSSVTDLFFETFGIPLLQGRGFNKADMDSPARAVIVSEAAAQRLWPAESPLGRSLAIRESTFATAGQPAVPDAIRICTVIGVARNVSTHVGVSDRAHLYLPQARDVGLTAAIFVRPRGDSPTLLAEIVRAADVAGLRLQFGQRLSAYHEQEMLPYFGLAVLSGALGSLALLMAVVGLYGVMAFAVNQRVREIGIRVALGATADRIVRLFVRQGMRLVVIGSAIGLCGGALFALLLAKVIPGLGGAFDPVAFGTVALIFSAIGLLACWLPARRATSIDPMVALRAE